MNPQPFTCMHVRGKERGGGGGERESERGEGERERETNRQTDKEVTASAVEQDPPDAG